MYPRHLSTIVVAICVCAWGAGQAAAAETRVVNWWDDYYLPIPPVANLLYRGQNPSASNGLDLDGDTQFDDSRLSYFFSMTTAMHSPADGVSVNGTWDRYRTDLPSAVFYGGIVTQFINHTPTNGKVGQANVQGDGADFNFPDPAYPSNIHRGQYPGAPQLGSELTLFVSDPGWTQQSQDFLADQDAAAKHASLFMWKQEDFINGGDADTVSFEPGNMMAVDVTRHWWDPAQQVRFVVQDTDGFWISEFFYQATDDESGLPTDSLEVGPSWRGEVVSIDPTQTQWAAYSPGLLSLEFDTATPFAARDFDDITALGVYVATHEYAHRAIGFVMDNFRVDAEVAPEPGSLALLGLAGLLIAGRGRRRAA
jgi:hypothetical protein